jgi:hypothetical protein
MLTVKSRFPAPTCCTRGRARLRDQIRIDAMARDATRAVTVVNFASGAVRSPARLQKRRRGNDP